MDYSIKSAVPDDIGKSWKNQQNFPPYLGFGILNKNSFSGNPDNFQADYLLDNQLVHRLEVSQRQVVLRHYFGQTNLGQYVSDSLEFAVNTGFQQLNFTQDPRYKYLLNKIASWENVHYLPPEVSSPTAHSIISPAVMLYKFRVVVTPENEAFLETFLQKLNASNRITNADGLEYLHLEDLYYSPILYLTDSGVVEYERVKVLEMSTMLAYLPLAIEKIQASRLIKNGWPYRMIVHDHTRQTDRKNPDFFQGQQSKGFKLYYIPERGVINHFPLDQLILAFALACQKLKESGKIL